MLSSWDRNPGQAQDHAERGQHRPLVSVVVTLNLRLFSKSALGLVLVHEASVRSSLMKELVHYQ
jgi:hypothetical protein